VGQRQGDMLKVFLECERRVGCSAREVVGSHLARSLDGDENGRGISLDEDVRSVRLLCSNRRNH
jgi:hypothetical protein